jgi:hypothetical protein
MAEWTTSHALAVLEAPELWRWAETHRIQAFGREDKFKAITPKLLSGFIAESQKLGGTLLEKFWDNLGNCHPKLKDNSWSAELVCVLQLMSLR